MSLEKRFNLGGRPLKFETPKDLSDVIDKYLDETPQEELSVTGLALEVGSKQLLNDYEKREGYADIVKRAKLIIENAYELALRKHGRSGDIFALKNFGWQDKTEVENTHIFTQMPVVKIDGKEQELNIG